MSELCPATPSELAQALADAASRHHKIRLGGNFSKPGATAGDVTISTRDLNRVLTFEPKDLTISVEAGLPYAELTQLLDQHQMMIPLDPPWSAQATIGGVVAANHSGPRRRLYGSARDLVIGMTFATLDGQVIQSGGMVVKNVAGLDMAKLLIGSYGTLAAMATINFKLIPKPSGSRTFCLTGATLEEVMQQRDAILRGVLQPVALDLLNPEAAERVGLPAQWSLLLQAAGNAALLDRYSRELSAAKVMGEEVWPRIQEFTPTFLAAHPQGRVARFSTTLTDVSEPFQVWRGPMIARAATGVAYGYSEKPLSLPAGFKMVIEYGESLMPWAQTGSDYSAMKRVKQMLDPQGLLNPGRLYARL
ncbi:MAG: FAD-binding oxidoreductase [Acidobacteria bacterium]|nr:FAD-binding oxidoreductase [Acidobacteriota bacterium]